MSALSLGGFALGAFVGSRLAPLLLQQGASSPYAPLFSLVTALMVGGLAAVIFEAMGESIRRRMAFPLAGTVDGIGGALLVAALGLALVWIAGAVALQTPGARKFRKDIQRSFILSKLNRHAAAVGARSSTRCRAPTRSRDPRARRQTCRLRPGASCATRTCGPRERSVVRVLGTACGLAVQGSGWVAEPGLVVTNAHVVAGEDDTTVKVNGGDELDANPILFDPHNDIALLRVDRPRRARAGTRHQALTAGDARGDPGLPRGRPLPSRPGRLGPTRTVLSQDAYGNGP